MTPIEFEMILATLTARLDRLDQKLDVMDVKHDKAISDLYDHLQKCYTSKTEFHPVRAIVFGIIGTIGMSFLLALIALAFRVIKIG